MEDRAGELEDIDDVASLFNSYSITLLPSGVPSLRNYELERPVLLGYFVLIFVILLSDDSI